MFTSYEAYMEEQRGYDYDTERIAVLRQDHYDPLDDLAYCGTHDTYFEPEEGCSEFHEPVEVEEVFVPPFDPADEPPF